MSTRDQELGFKPFYLKHPQAGHNSTTRVETAPCFRTVLASFRSRLVCNLHSLEFEPCPLCHKCRWCCARRGSMTHSVQGKACAEFIYFFARNDFISLISEREEGTTTHTHTPHCAGTIQIASDWKSLHDFVILLILNCDISPRFEARQNLYVPGIDSEVMVSDHKPWIQLNSSQLKDEFVSCMKNPRIVAYMSSVGVSVHDVQHLFKIVANENDEVDIDRFVDGCDLARIAFCFSWLDMQPPSNRSSWMELLFHSCTSQAWPLRAQRVRWICKSSFITCSRWPKRSTPGSATIGPGCCKQLGTSAVEMDEGWWREKGARGPVLRNEGTPSSTRLFESKISKVKLRAKFSCQCYTWGWR